MLWESKIRLGEDFYNEIISHPVPLNMNTLTALKRCSLGLDLYMWLAYRTFPLRAPQRDHLASGVPSVWLVPGQGQRQVHRPQLPHKGAPRVEENQAGLAGVELLHGSGPPDPASLDPDDSTGGIVATAGPIALRKPQEWSATHKAAMLRWRRDDPSSMGKKPTTHIVDADREIPATFDSAAAFSLCGVFLYKSEQVDNADPSCQKCLRYRHLASPDERPHGAKGRLRTSGSPRNDKRGSRHPFPGPQRSFRIGLDLWYPPDDPVPSEAVNRLFPTGLCESGEFSSTKPDHPQRMNLYQTGITTARIFVPNRITLTSNKEQVVMVRQVVGAA